MDNPFLQDFIKRNQTPITYKTTTTKVKETPKTDTTPGKEERKSIKEFASSKPSGKDVEKWFRERIAELEITED